MARGKTRGGPGSVPSAVLPFLTVRTDGKAKERHNRELMRVFRLLRGDGVREFRLHHVNEGGQSREIPIALDGKFYDIGYIAEDGEVFLIEIMRVGHLGKRQGYEDGPLVGLG